MYKCNYCPLTSKKKWNIQVHEARKHTDGAIQKGSGVLTREQPITQDQTSRQTQNVPIQYIEYTKGIIRQWQEAYQNMQMRNKELLNGWQNQNKQWEAAYRQLQAWREEDGEYSEEAQQQLSYLQNNAGR
jgi:hypothetical protein